MCVCAGLRTGRALLCPGASESWSSEGLLNSCLMRAAYVSLNIEICLCQRYFQFAFSQRWGFFLQVRRTVPYGCVESMWKMGVQRGAGGRS